MSNPTRAQQLARLAARLALRAIQAPPKPRTLAAPVDAQTRVNQISVNTPKLTAVHAAAIRAGIAECNEGDEAAAKLWDRTRAQAVALAPWLQSLGLVLINHATDPRGPMLALAAAPADVAPGWPPLFDQDRATETEDGPTPCWILPC